MLILRSQLSAAVATWDALGRHAARGVATFSPRCISNTAWGFATAGIKEHAALFDAFAAHMQASIRDISGADPSAPAESIPMRCPNCGAHAVKPASVLFGAPLALDVPPELDDALDDVDLVPRFPRNSTLTPQNHHHHWRHLEGIWRHLEPSGTHMGDIWRSSGGHLGDLGPQGGPKVI